MTLARSVVVAGLLAIAVAAGLVLSRSAPRRSGTDVIPAENFVEPLARGEQLCQSHEQLPADTQAVRLLIDAHGQPVGRLGVRFTGGAGQIITTGALRAGSAQGIVRIPLSLVRDTSEARFCLRNYGPSTIRLAGASDQPGVSLSIGRHLIEDQSVRVEYMRPGRESWLALTGALAHRFSLGRAFFMSAWALPAALLLLAISISGAVYLLTRESA